VPFVDYEVARAVRWILLVGGLALVVTGAVATFVGRLALPAAALVVIGAAGCLLGAIGRWPASLSWGNARVGFANEIRNEIAEALSTAPASARPTLERIRERVSTIEAEQTPRVAAAIAYDDEVERAMHRVVHGAVLRRESQWSRDRADFWLVVGDRELYIETKYVGSSMTFAGSSLDGLLDRLSGSGRLLVITNAVDVERARERVTSRLGNRGAVVTWRSSADDDQLEAGIVALTAAV
jgi:hypothetical protein